MEKKNTLLLTVIAIATLLVAVVGATFAYFASFNENDLGNVIVTANTESSNSLFTATGGSISLSNITALNMQQSQAAVFSDSATANLTVTYNADSETARTCSYDVVYKWVSGDYAATTINEAPATQEFTYQIAGANTQAETNFVNSSVTATQTVFTHETITSTNTTVTNDYAITAKFYNINADQSDLAGQSWNLEFSVANVVC